VLCYEQKVAGLNPDEVIDFFKLPNPSSRTLALEFTQPLTKMSTRNLAGGKADNLVSRCLENMGSLTSHSPIGFHGLLQ
jgi:hypothetical protein